MQRFLIVAGLMVSGAVEASSRLVVDVSDPVTIYVDGMAIQSAMPGQSVKVNHLESGSHAVVFRDQQGQIVDEEWLYVPEGIQILATFDLAAGFVVTYPEGGTSPPDEEERAAADDETENTFDKNEGDGTSHATPTTEDSSTSDQWNAASREVRNIVGTTASVVAPGTTSVVNSVAAPVVRTAASSIRNAEAGGVDALRGSGPTFQQGRPIPPQAKTGTVDFFNLLGEPAVIYLEGFTLAVFESGEKNAKVKLEIGRHTIEIWDGDTMRVRYKGVLQIDEGFTVQLAFSDGSPPEATNRSWSWSAR